MQRIEYLDGEYVELNGQEIKGPNGVEKLPNYELLILEKLISAGNGKIVSYKTFFVEIWNESEYSIEESAIKDFRTNRFNKRWSNLNKIMNRIAPNAAERFLKRDNVLGCSINYVSLKNIDNSVLNRIKLFETYREEIANVYYEEYKNVILQQNTDRMNQSLVDVFCFPDFVGGELLDLSDRKNVFICAPNGFGKSTLLKAILFATNPSDKLNEKPEAVERIQELRKHFGIKKDYLTLFINLPEVNIRNAFNNDEDLCKWLLYASHLDGIMKLEEFRELVTYYNQNDRLMLIFDSLDELVQEKEINIGREEVLTKIRLLISADEISGNAKVLFASRPLVSNKDDRSYRYLYIESLNANQEKIEAIIEKYAPKYKEELVRHIYEDLYLKYLVLTPQLLIAVISRVLLSWYNDGDGKYKIIKSIIRNTMMRFEHMGNIEFLERNYEHIYEIFAYVSLFNDVENDKNDFATFQELILDNELEYQQRRRKPLEPNDIVYAYEHFCLFNTQGKKLELLANEVLRPYYLATYMYKFLVLSNKVEGYNSKKIWNKFDSILKNKYQSDEYLYDMLVFFFGIMHEGLTEDGRYDPDSLEYNVWIDYVVYRWNTVSKDEASKRIFSDRLKYLLESDFVKKSCFERILEPDIVLNDNEMQLKSILNEIK